MTFRRRLYFYSIGALLGILLSVMLFGPERFSCSGYLPNGRVLAELESKKWMIDSTQNSQLQQFGIDSTMIKDSILRFSTIHFEESLPRKKPCGEYMLYYPSKESKLKIYVSKCKTSAQILSIESIK